MTRFQKDRRLAGRFGVKTPLRVRVWKSALPEYTAESVNLSQRGIYFATDSLLREGETVEVFSPTMGGPHPVFRAETGKARRRAP